MDLLWCINESSFNGWVSISAGCLDESIGRMDIVELSNYARKWWYFTLIYIFLGFMYEAWANISAPLLSSNSLHRPVGETVPTLYPRAFIYFMSSMIIIFSRLLTEYNILSLCRDEGYIYLKLWLLHNWTSKIWYNKSWARMFHIWIILTFLYKPINA